MPARGRSRDLAYINGPNAVITNFGNSVMYTGYKGFTGVELCNDTTMPRPYDQDHELKVVKRMVESPVSFDGGFLFWNGGNPTVAIDMNGHIPQIYANSAHLPNPDEPAWNYWTTKAIADLSPDKPDTGIPLFLFEFKDFPEMLRHAGRVLMRKASASDYPGTYLAVHFGWAPLVSDVRNLFNLAKLTDNRMKYLARLKGGTKVRHTLFSGLTGTTSTPTAYESLPAWPEHWLYTANIETRTSSRVWYTVNAELAPGYTLPTVPGDFRALTARQSLGLTSNPAAVWEFLPWSWLVDYFSNVGDFLQAVHGQVMTKTSRMNIMHSTEIVVTHSNQRCVAGVQASAYFGRVTDKRRHPVSNPIPMLSSRPFLGAAQVFALENLVTARAFAQASGITRVVRN